MILFFAGEQPYMCTGIPLLAHNSGCFRARTP